MTTTASTSRVRDLRRMLDTSAERLADAKADAAVAPVECAHTSDASTNRLTDAKADAKDSAKTAIGGVSDVDDTEAHKLRVHEAIRKSTPYMGN